MRKIKKIVLINPMYKRKGYYGGLHNAYQPIALGVLASLTPKDIKIVLIDEKFENSEDALDNEDNIDLVGITGFTPNIARGYEIARIIKKKGIPVIMGGIHVSFNPDEALNYCESVVIGEAEGLWQKVLKDFEEGSIKKIYKHEENIENIEPVAARRDIFDKYHYRIGGIQTARGCPMNCDFCSVTAFNGFKYRKRNIEDIISELKQIKQKEVFFYDDNIIGRTKEQKEYSLNLFKRIVGEKIKKIWACQSSLNVGEDEELLKWMYKSGCRIILIGFESIDKDNLKTMNKAYNLSVYDRYAELIRNIHRNGIAILGAFIVGYPKDGIETVKIITDFINKFKIDVYIISYMTPLPGTKLFKKMQDENRILTSNYPEDWKKYEFVNVVYQHEKLTKEELEKIMYELRAKLTVPFDFLLTKFFRTLKETGKLSTALLALRHNFFYRQTYINRLKYIIRPTLKA